MERRAGYIRVLGANMPERIGCIVSSLSVQFQAALQRLSCAATSAVNVEDLSVL